MLHRKSTTSMHPNLNTQLSMSRMCTSFTLWCLCLPPNITARERSTFVKENPALGRGLGPVVSGELQVATEWKRQFGSTGIYQTVERTMLVVFSTNYFGNTEGHAKYSYSGTSDNGHSEKWTTSIEWTNCLPPTNRSMHSVHIYL